MGHARHGKDRLQIGEVSERTGVTQRALRFYEEKGLLCPADRMEGGFRLYSEEDVQRIHRIKELQVNMGFSLAEIREVLEAEDVRNELRAHWHDPDVRVRGERLSKAIEVTESLVKLIDQKSERLGEMRAFWAGRLARYKEVLAELTEAPRPPSRS